jgi:hypothetical protein
VVFGHPKVSRQTQSPFRTFFKVFPAVVVDSDGLLLWLGSLRATRKYPRGKPVVEDRAIEMERKDVLSWIESNHAVILDSEGLDLPEEA